MISEVTLVSTLKKNQQPGSKKKSFIVLKKILRDPLNSAKFKFFEMLSQPNTFLRGFQTDNPMVSFADVLGGIVRDLLERIILKGTLMQI